MQWIKLLRRCRHKYVITYRTDRLLILTCTECGTTKSIRLGDKQAWLKQLRDEIYWAEEASSPGWLERMSKAFEAFRDRHSHSPSRRMMKIGYRFSELTRKQIEGDKR